MRKEILLVALLLPLMATTISASFGEVATPGGVVYYNFTQAGQTITNTWYLVNSGNQSVLVNVIVPTDPNFKVMLDTSTKITVPPFTLKYPINVTIEVFKPVHYVGYISAMEAVNVTGASISIGTAKKLSVNYGPSNATNGLNLSVSSPQKLNKTSKSQNNSPGGLVVKSSNSTTNSTGTGNETNGMNYTIIAIVAVIVICAVSGVAYVKHRKNNKH